MRHPSYFVDLLHNAWRHSRVASFSSVFVACVHCSQIYAYVILHLTSVLYILIVIYLLVWS